jgi:hypothetical protein
MFKNTIKCAKQVDRTQRDRHPNILNSLQNHYKPKCHLNRLLVIWRKNGSKSGLMTDCYMMTMTITTIYVLIMQLIKTNILELLAPKT